MDAQCNICLGREFEDFNGRASARCSSCKSLERGRLLVMYLFEQVSLPADASVLHVAPEECIYDKLRQRSEIGRYQIADIEPERYKFGDCAEIDLCELDDWESDQFDLILHSHVLEHTFCNIAYSLFHLHRMLKPNGRHIFVVPFTRSCFEESFEDLSGSERTRRFGQWDHTRRFGADDIDRHLGKILRIPSEFDAERLFGSDALERANIPPHMWQGFHGSTILDVAKGDYLL